MLPPCSVPPPLVALAQCGTPLTVPHARHSAPLDQMDFEIDATVQYSCFPGYESKGFTEAKCLFYNNTAQWFGPDLKCIRKFIHSCNPKRNRCSLRHSTHSSSILTLPLGLCATLCHSLPLCTALPISLGRALPPSPKTTPDRSLANTL